MDDHDTELVSKVTNVAEECRLKSESVLAQTLEAKRELELRFDRVKENNDDYSEKMDEVIFTF